MEDFCQGISPFPRIRLYFREVLPEPSLQCHHGVKIRKRGLEMFAKEPGHRRALASSAQGEDEVITRNNRGDQEIPCVPRSIIEQDPPLPAQCSNVVIERGIRGRRDNCKYSFQESMYTFVWQACDIT